jgi:flagellar hook-associated protein FlgK
MFNEGTLEDFLNGTSNFLAVDNHQAMRFRQNYHEMSHATQNQRAAVSGVSYVEELMDMQRFTALFNNNARMMQAINEIYDTLINRLGI